MISGGKCFDRPVINNIETYKNTAKITAGQEGDYTTGSLLFYPSFKEHYKMIAIDLKTHSKV